MALAQVLLAKLGSFKRAFKWFDFNCSRCLGHQNQLALARQLRLVTRFGDSRGQILSHCRVRKGQRMAARRRIRFFWFYPSHAGDLTQPASGTLMYYNYMMCVQKKFVNHPNRCDLDELSIGKRHPLKSAALQPQVLYIKNTNYTVDRQNVTKCCICTRWSWQFYELFLGVHTTYILSLFSIDNH